MRHLILSGALAALMAVPAAAQTTDAPERSAVEGIENRAADIADEVTVTEADREPLAELSHNAVAGMQASNLASGKDIELEVRQLSERIAAAQAEIADRLTALDADLPTEMREEDQAAINEMRALNGPEFSRAYVAFITETYNDSLDLLRQAEGEQNGDAVAAVAGDLQPELQDQLDAAQQIQLAETPESPPAQD